MISSPSTHQLVSTSSPQHCGWLWLALGLLSCPCHLLILLPLLRGTLLGSWLSLHYLPSVLVLLLISLVATLTALRLLDHKPG
ncbi:mercury resistance protein [Motiliproteus sp.]|uniref:mercury resistance protein n=1 Tax=Motiliproteus sp. TaxID=1898955 RepID=UPI003BAC75E7